jgi:hypothetical protein
VARNAQGRIVRLLTDTFTFASELIADRFEISVLARFHDALLPIEPPLSSKLTEADVKLPLAAEATTLKTHVAELLDGRVETLQPFLRSLRRGTDV